MKLVAEKNLDQPLQTLCERVKFGQCLCGMAALTRQTLHTSCIDHRHTTNFEGMEPHGHYNIPILSRKKVLGVIVLYLPHGKEKDDEEVAFIERVASILSLMIELRHKELQLQQINKQLTDSNQRAKLATTSARIGVWEWNFRDHTIHWDEQMFRIYGLEPTKNGFVDYSVWSDAVIPEDLPKQEQILNDTIKRLAQSEREFRIKRYDNKEICIIHSIESVRTDENGVAEWVIGTNHDITQRIRDEEATLRLAMTDQLTSLANRHQFHQRFDELLKLAKREKNNLALMFMDLNKFKTVNDSYGHQTGDLLLKSVADILKRQCRETDVIARLGGDEFAIILINPENEHSASECAQRIIDQICKPIIIESYEISIGICIGISMYPIHSDNEEGLIQKADQALYKAKSSGQSTFIFTQ